MFSNDKGQSLIELIVVISVSVIIIAALTFASIAALRNAQSSKIQAQATKYAQEGIEKVKIIRDRNLLVGNDTFNTEWSAGTFNCPTKCSFKLSRVTCPNDAKFASSCTNPEEVDKITKVANSIYETSADATGLPVNLRRQITVENVPANANEKKITSRVVWEDFAGTHESTLVTFMKK